MKYMVLFLLVLMTTSPAMAAMEIFACEPEWAALADEIGGDKVATVSATTALQDPHFIQARPSLLARVRRANLVICTGANLEIGWLPVLMRQSANASVNVGTDGFLDASQSVRLLEIPLVADRSAGDIHPYGNPHFQLDPRNIALVATTLVGRLKKLDPTNASYYQSRYEAFVDKWSKALVRWQAEAAPLKGMELVVHHSAWVYLEDWLQLREVGQMEPKPGLPPTAAHLAELLEVTKTHPVKAFIRSAYQSPRAADWLAERTGVPEVLIPHTVAATEEAKDLVTWFDDVIRRLLEVNR